MALLEVTDLKVSFDTPDGVVHAVRGLSFDVERGRTLAIVGESGSGKSVSTQTVTGLTRGAAISGSALFDGTDLLTADRQVLRAIRGAEIGMIFQDPLSSLHPYYRVGWQIVEMIRAHDKSISKRAARQRAAELLKLVGIPRAESRIDDYPHQFSGGMRQRVMIAMAMALDPALLVADEPTTALDVTVQAQVLAVISDLQTRFGTAVVLITHDLGVVAQLADEVIVMYAGTAMERAPRREIFYRHHNPYTEGLLKSLPSWGTPTSGLPASDTSSPGTSSHGTSNPATGWRSQRLTPIPGVPPSLIGLPPGCPFAPRCPYVFDRCRVQAPPLIRVGGDPRHTSACWLPDGARP